MTVTEVMTTEEKHLDTESTEKIVCVKNSTLYGISFFQTSGMLLIFTFFQYFGIILGATGFIQGILVSVRNLGSNIFQYVWGKIADKRGRKIVLCTGLAVMSLGSLITAFVFQLWQFFIMAVIITTIGFMFLPAWIGLLGDLTSVKERGEFVGKIQSFGSYLSIFVVLFVGIAMDQISDGKFIREAFIIPFTTAAAVFFVSFVLALLFIKENPLARIKKNERLAQDTRSVLDLITTNPPYRRLLTINTLFSATMAFLWPILPFVTLNVAHNWTEVVLVWVVFQLPRAFSQQMAGKLSDKIGRKTVLIITRSLFVAVPLTAFLSLVTGDYLWLLMSSVAGGIGVGGDDAVLTSYTLDCSSSDTMARHYSILLTLGGIIMFVASLFSGFLFDVINTLFEFRMALEAMLLLISGARLVGVLTHLLLKKPINT